MQYIVDEYKKTGNEASSKAREDIFRIFPEWKRLYLFPGGRSLSGRLAYPLQLLRMRIFMKEKDVLLYQWPTYMLKPFAYSRPEKWSAAKKICLIHDVESLRYRNLEEWKKKSELQRLNQFEVLIVHNREMANALEQLGVTRPMVSLGIFDYITEERETPDDKAHSVLYPEQMGYPENQVFKIAIAGNLSKKKSGYLYALENFEGIAEFHLFGGGYEETEKKNRVEEEKIRIYEGSFSPEEITHRMNCHFGLVWDGDRTDTCEGDTGQYLRYNNPHKASLYLRSGMPVIVWEEAAIAAFIRKEGVGITIRDLEELPEKFKNMKQEEYLRMLKNVKGISKRLQDGYYTKNAVEKAINICN